ncbi:MAG TPA: hypothetical protein VMF65_05980 [Acidimicrobiales bacterium]|nr:hypothetical protein [Acidimicrobiales bacterium]
MADAVEGVKERACAPWAKMASCRCTLTSDEETLSRYRARTAGGETSLHPVWAGEAIDLIHDVPPAGDIVRDLVRVAENVLRSLVPAT